MKGLSSGPRQPRGVVALLGRHVAGLTTTQLPAGHHPVRTPQLAAGQGFVDPLTYNKFSVRLAGEQHPETHPVADSLRRGVSRSLETVPSGERRAVFENKQHDFPQRILYWLDAEGAMHARIEGPQGGKTISLEWVWKKARP